jgi:hypothetical protein
MWGAIAGDAINNLRSALDVLWRQATNPTGRKAYFPFDTADGLKGRLSRVKQAATKDAFRLLLAAEIHRVGQTLP